MTNTEINRTSQRIFGSLILPNWAIRSQEDQEDYGIDAEIEITTANDQATGFIFKTQLKGTIVAKYNESAELVYSKASVSHFDYYLRQVKVPIIFVVCDVIGEECYWTQAQGNHDIESAFEVAIAEKQETFTIKFPSSQKIEKSPGSAEAIIRAVERAQDAIALRCLQEMSADSFRRQLLQRNTASDLGDQLRLFAGLATIKEIGRELRAGNFEEAYTRSKEVLESATESCEVRILTGTSLVHSYLRIRMKTKHPEPFFDSAKFKFQIGAKMLQISRRKGCEKRFQRYAAIYTRAARMEVNARIAHALTISELMQQGREDTLSGPITLIQRSQASALVTRDFFRLCDRLRQSGTTACQWVIPYGFTEVLNGLIPYVASLRMLEHGELADAYLEGLMSFVPFCCAIIRTSEDNDEIGELLRSIGLRLLGLVDTAKPGAARDLLKRYQELLEVNDLTRYATLFVESAERFVKEIESDKNAPEKPTTEQCKRLVAEQAERFGINLDDQNDQNAKMVRLGLADLDPTRVSRDCQHIHIFISTYGMLAEQLGLPTAGRKEIVCLKHGHSIDGMSLDRAYEAFRKPSVLDENQICCDNCLDTKPHPEDWNWTPEWQSEQEAKYDDLVKRHSAKDVEGDDEE